MKIEECGRVLSNDLIMRKNFILEKLINERGYIEMNHFLFPYTADSCW